ncbi:MULTISPECIES: hypothetical protein [Corynebacterium]|uniref:hypothetical protein n=1 Tax=Corynebacterium TaxID=1716 RepID=UPI0008A87430|nr:MULTISPECIES: hypothetical protein [Corynebacterium]MBC6762922.1 hypothetical protein [Corynebacterium sp. LK27]MDK7110006.1 hypothetical protein [Corynebacterium amycolatum]MDK7144864.1 hypothetical protein [Corynebacterium amycolatum]OHR30459.1 hypothetical protein HMPREF2847_06385 [Corynebacterium sp. HMSC074C03]
MTDSRDIKPFASNRGPKVTSIGAIIGTAAVGGLLLGGVGAGACLAVFNSPERSDYVMQPAQREVQADIMDPDDVLTPEEEQRMLRDVSRIAAPDVVQGLHYMVFAENKENVNDSVEEYLRDNHQELIGKDKFADGQVFVGVGLDPRQAFVFAGEDVAAQMKLRKNDSHLKQSIEAIKPGVRDDNIPAGLFAGAAAAIDVDRAADTQYEGAKEDRMAAAVGLGVAGLSVGGAGVGLAGGVRRSRQKKTQQAREDWDYVSQTYTDVAQRLREIDIRAHSLQSGLVDERLRQDWEGLRDDFLAIDSQVGSLMSIPADAPDEQFRSRSELIANARQLCERVETAEANIEKLHRIENADADARRYELYELEKDLAQAGYLAASIDPALERHAKELEDATTELSKEPHHPQFMERYLELLDRSALLSEHVQSQLQKRNEADERPERTRIYDSNFFAGSGYHGYVPFYVVSTWDSDATTARDSSSSSGGVNSGFSSGFSGSGGSSSF